VAGIIDEIGRVAYGLGGMIAGYGGESGKKEKGGERGGAGGCDGRGVTR
jgi:hypothetical protein